MPAKKGISIALARTGGVAGIRPPPVVLDTAGLAPVVTRRLEELIVAADFFSLPAELPERKPHPDAFQHSLTIKMAAGRMHTVTFSEKSAANRCAS
jgi:hypothetical protein